MTLNIDGQRVRLVRAYDPPEDGAGSRILVDRVWPRGRSRADLRIDEWLPEVAPSTDLRRWFGHVVDRWPEFRTRYRAELERGAQAVALAQLEARAERGPITLVYGARDRDHNQAVVLAEVLTERLARTR
jgi:uncharacterized protein YeaO (DUF488 family)